jgi:2-hydroxychromene-2-carboxylate isomerase
VVAVQQGWYLDYLETTYRLWFVAGLAAGSERNLQQTCAALGQDYGALLSQAQAPNTYKDYQHNTALARSVGVFGAPSFQVESELYLGDDRLDDAIVHFPKIWFETSDFSRKRFQLCAAGALNH